MKSLHWATARLRRFAIAGSAAAGLSTAACSPSNLEPASARGLTSHITAISRDPTGTYVVALSLTNADTGAIAYWSGCPATLQVWRNREWTDTGGGVCRLTAKTLEPGASLQLMLHSSEISSGDVVRTVSPWTFFNGTLPGDSAISLPVAVH